MSLAPERGVDERLEEDGETKGTGVDDAVLLEDGQQVGGAGDGLVGLDNEGVERLLHRQLLLLALIRLSGDVAQDGQDRALNGLTDGLEGNLDGTAERGCDVGAGHGLVGVLEALGHAAQNLRGNDAGVATGTHERAVGDGTGDGLHVGVDGQNGKLLHDRLQREGHVGTGVSVGHGEHVELVDLLRLLSNSVDGDGETGANGLCNHLIWHFRLVNAGSA